MSWTTYTTVNGQILHQDKDGVGTHLIPDTLGNIIATIDEAGRGGLSIRIECPGF